MNDPYWNTREVPSFRVTSPDFAEGGALPRWARSGVMGAGGEDRSPALAWSGAPASAKSFVVTCFDPDAPTFSGFWHWLVVDLPAGTTGLPQGAGTPDAGLLPIGTMMLTNDGGFQCYLGAAPPAGHGPHRYFFTVNALDVERLEVAADAQAAGAMFQANAHTIARATIVGTAVTP